MNLTDASAAYFGTQPVSKIYLGATEVWSSTPVEEPVSTNLVVNGDFSQGTDNWTGGNGGVLSTVDGKLRVTRQSITNPFAYQLLGLQSGKTYRVTGTIVSQSLPSAQNIIRIGTAPGSGNFLDNRAAGARSVNLTFLTQASSVYLSILYLVSSNGEYFELDNFSIEEV